MSRSGSNVFISFSDVASSTYQSTQTQNSPTQPSDYDGISPVYTGSDNHTMISCKKLLKKDDTTKLKALNELLETVKHKDEIYLNEFLPHFCYLFLRIGLDNNRQLREKLCQLLNQLIAINNKSFGTYMKTLIGLWWMLKSDPIKEVSDMASIALNTAIPMKKRKAVVLHLAPNILKYIQHNLNCTPETLSDRTLFTIEEIEERYERIIISSFYSLKSLLEQYEEGTGLMKLFNLDSNTTSTTTTTTTTTTSVLSATIDTTRVMLQNIWKASSSTSTQIRQASYIILKQLNISIPSVFNTMKITATANKIITILLENNDNNITYMLDLVINLLSTHSDLWLNNIIDFEKHILRTLLSHIKPITTNSDSSSSSCVASADRKSTNSYDIHKVQTILQYILPILGLLPPELISLHSTHKQASHNRHILVTKLYPILDSIIDTFTPKEIRLSDSLSTNISRDIPSHHLQVSISSMITIIESCLLLLLRRISTSPTATSVTTSISATVQETTTNIIFQYLHAYIIRVVNLFVHIQHRYKDNIKFIEIYQNIQRSFYKVCNQLHRATIQQINFDLQLWTIQLWTPLLHDISNMMNKYLNFHKNHMKDDSSVDIEMIDLNDNDNDALNDSNLDINSLCIEDKVIQGTSENTVIIHHDDNDSDKPIVLHNTKPTGFKEKSCTQDIIDQYYTSISHAFKVVLHNWFQSCVHNETTTVITTTATTTTTITSIENCSGLMYLFNELYNYIQGNINQLHTILHKFQSDGISIDKTTIQIFISMLNWLELSADMISTVSKYRYEEFLRSLVTSQHPCLQTILHIYHTYTSSLIYVQTIQEMNPADVISYHPTLTKIFYHKIYTLLHCIRQSNVSIHVHNTESSSNIDMTTTVYQQIIDMICEVIIQTQSISVYILVYNCSLFKDNMKRLQVFLDKTYAKIVNTPITVVLDDIKIVSQLYERILFLRSYYPQLTLHQIKGNIKQLFDHWMTHTSSPSQQFYYVLLLINCIYPYICNRESDILRDIWHFVDIPALLTQIFYHKSNEKFNKNTMEIQVRKIYQSIHDIYTHNTEILLWIWGSTTTPYQDIIVYYKDIHIDNFIMIISQLSQVITMKSLPLDSSHYTVTEWLHYFMSIYQLVNTVDMTHINTFLLDSGIIIENTVWNEWTEHIFNKLGTYIYVNTGDITISENEFPFSFRYSIELVNEVLSSHGGCCDMSTSLREYTLKLYQIHHSLYPAFTTLCHIYFSFSRLDIQCNTDLIEHVKELQIILWEYICNDLNSFAEYLIQELTRLKSLQSQNDIDLMTLKIQMCILNNIITHLFSSEIAMSAESFIHHLQSTLSSIDIFNLISPHSYNSAYSIITTQLISLITSNTLQGTDKPALFTPHGKYFEYPVDRDCPVTYIKLNSDENDIDKSELNTISYKILRIHREDNVDDPYYTLYKDDNNTYSEIQTEKHRMVINADMTNMDMKTSLLHLPPVSTNIRNLQQMMSPTCMSAGYENSQMINTNNDNTESPIEKDVSMIIVTREKLLTYLNQHLSTMITNLIENNATTTSRTTTTTTSLTHDISMLQIIHTILPYLNSSTTLNIYKQILITLMRSILYYESSKIPLFIPKNTSNFCLFVNIFTALTENSIIYENTLWISQILYQMENITKNMKSTSILVFYSHQRDTCILVLNQLYISLLTQIESNYLYNIMIEYLLYLFSVQSSRTPVPPSLTEANITNASTTDTSVHIELSTLHMIHHLWCNSKKYTTTANSGINTKKKSDDSVLIVMKNQVDWEPACFIYCLQLLIHTSTIDTTVTNTNRYMAHHYQEIHLLACHCLHMCILNRTRNDLKILVDSCRHILSPLIPTLINILTSSQRLSSIVTDWSYVVIAKVLDIYYASTAPTDMESADSLSKETDRDLNEGISEASILNYTSAATTAANTTAISTAPANNTTSNSNIDDDDGDNIEHDRQVFESICHPDLYHAFYTLLSHIHIPTNTTNKNNTNGSLMLSPSSSSTSLVLKSSTSSTQLNNDISITEKDIEDNSDLHSENKQDKSGAEDAADSDTDSNVLKLILMWLVILQQLESNTLTNRALKIQVSSYLRKSNIFNRMMQFLYLHTSDMLKYKHISHLFGEFFPAYSDSTCTPHTNTHTLQEIWKIHEDDIEKLAIYAIYRSMSHYPSVTRGWWTDICTRQQKEKITRFIEDRVRKSLVSKEIALIGIAYDLKRWNSEEFSVKGSSSTGEVVASYTKEDTVIEIKIKLPSSYPLKNVEVECTSRVGVSEQRWRRWVLQIIQLISSQDGSVIDAILFWKTNIEKELNGVEPCPICYCVLHTKTMSIPTLKCNTCNNKFHNICLYTWFKSSGKSKCVLCQQPFFQ